MHRLRREEEEEEEEEEDEAGAILGISSFLFFHLPALAEEDMSWKPSSLHPPSSFLFAAGKIGQVGWSDSLTPSVGRTRGKVL